MTNYYEILGVSRGATASEISQTYRRLLQDVYQEMGREADLASLSHAHKMLINPAKRREYDALLDLLSGQFIVEDPEEPTKAEKAYLEGLKAFDLQNYQEAVQYFARAARLDPKQGHFFSQWGLSIGMFPGRLSEAELYCKKAIELDSDNPVFYFNLGFLYQRHNLSEAAQQSFIKAQEAQQVRQAKHAAQQSAAISAPWGGDAGRPIKKHGSIEDNITQSDGEQPSVIVLPHAEEAVPESKKVDQPVSTAEPEREQALAEEPVELSGIDDLLSELDSLESSMDQVETFNNGNIREPEEPKLELVTVQEELSAQSQSGESHPLPDSQIEVKEVSADPKLEIVTVQEELIAQSQSGDILTPELPGETESLNESSLDLLKELDSIETMVAGIEQAGMEAQPEDILENPQQRGISNQPGLPVISDNDVLVSKIEDLENEALKVLPEPDSPSDDQPSESAMPNPNEEIPAAVSQGVPKLKKKIPRSDSEAIREKMERLNQMEEQMMEELLRLKAERVQLRANLEA